MALNRIHAQVIRRRALLGAVASVPLLTLLDGLAQQPRNVRRIGFLGAATAAGYATRIDALRAGLREHGYEEGRNLVIEFRWAEGRYDQLPALAAELVRLDVEVIVTHAIPPTLAASRATTTIPIVMTNVADAVAAGIVKSLARPGGNVTGDTFFVAESVAKRLEILRDFMPGARRIGILLNPANPVVQSSTQPMDDAAGALRLSLKRFDVRSAGELDGAFAAMARDRMEALAIVEDAVFVANWKSIADLAIRHRLPSIGFTDYATAGGLIGYGADPLVLYRRAAHFVDRILKGARPADLPIERPKDFVLAVNLRTAKAIGVVMPTALLLRAEQVIQ